MLQNGLFPITIIRETAPKDSTADLKVVGEGSDGHRYAVKRLEDAPLLPITEWVCYWLCHAVGIATPDCAAVHRLTGDIAFGSRLETNADQVNGARTGAGPVPVQIARLFTASAMRHCSSIYGFDAVVGNVDRHLGNFLFRKTTSGQLPLAFDFSQAWVHQQQPFGHSPWPPASNSARCATYFAQKRMFDRAAAESTVNALVSLPDDTLNLALAAADPSWLTAIDWQPTLDAWANRGAVLHTAALACFP